MWADFSGKDYSRNELADRIDSLNWTTWKPVGITLHNTAAPTLAQWAESGPKHDARIRNLQNYYESPPNNWKGGPHWFVSRTRITEFSNPLRRGTHSPSFNATHFGIEMVGDYAVEPFDSGDGALVRDNSVYLMALLCKKFGWDPAKVIVLHKEDPRTNHDCPGKLVRKADVIARVKGVMEGGIIWEDQAPTANTDRQTGILATEFGDESETQEGAYGGMVDPDQPGAALPAHIKAPRRRIRVYKGARSVDVDIVDKGPHNIEDPYWETGARPLAEKQFAEKLRDFKNRPVTNPAGIDFTPAVFDALMIPGRRGTRSSIVDWEWLDETTPPPRRPAEPTDDPAAPVPGTQAVEIEVVQRRLLALGYHEVGDVDGKWGGKTAAGIAGFKNDRHVSGGAVIDAAVLAELTKAEAENWKRPIAAARSEATEETVAKKAPEIVPVQQNRFYAFWGAISSAVVGAVSFIGDQFKEVMTWITQFKGYFDVIPGWVWFVGLAGVLLFFYLRSKKGVEGMVAAVRTGERN